MKLKLKLNKRNVRLVKRLMKIKWLAGQWLFRLDEVIFKCLRQIDGRSIPDQPGEIRLFMIVRNESLRLPFILAHYRRLGVNRFFIVDNNSSDTTREFLLQQPNIHVFFTGRGYKRHWRWMEFLLEKYGMNYWCLVVDADEVFIYPYYEELSLREFCDYLEQQKSSALPNLLVDMYPNQDIACHQYQPGQDLIQSCGYFDPYCYRRLRARHYDFKANKPYYFWVYLGGTREKIFELKDICSSKFSLLKYEKPTVLQQGMHSAHGVRLSKLQGVVLHFKFLADFRARAKEEAARGEHWNHGYEYKFYTWKMEHDHFETPYHEDSLKYRDSRQLIELGFMRSSPGLEAFLAEKRRMKNRGEGDGG